MAAEIVTADKMTILKNTKILVNIEEALPDILVVSYLNENRKFQGVLLDTSKRDLPFGITNLHPAFDATSKRSNEDKLYSVNQRFIYLEPNHKFDVRPPQKSKPQPRPKMTVRLRPRKVLCSKCKGVCNENSENVDLGGKRKTAERSHPSREKKPYLSVNCSSISEDSKTLFMGHSLIPKLSRLQPSEISNAINGSAITNRHEIWLKSNDIGINSDDFSADGPPKCVSSSQSDIVSEADIYSKADYSSSDFLSENRNIGNGYEVNSNGFVSHSMEDLDKNELNLKKQNCDKLDSGWDDKNSGSLFSNARTLKISFGEGEGTVVKIPALVNSYDCKTDETFKNEENVGDKVASKAAKKALKKAKKHARKRITLPPPFVSPRRSPGGNCTSPRYIGALSPRYTISSNTVSLDLLQRRHKHKVKHKKKHRLDKKLFKNCDPSGKEHCNENDTAIKERCLKQKLSISLKRLSTNSYAKNEDNLLIQDRRSSNSSSDTWEEDNCCIEIPEFPAEMLGQEVSNSEDRMNVVRAGDVVWGKVTGFPWWPGKVVDVRPGGQEAHVSWYASNTSSLMPCHNLSPFIEDFKNRFNKKKRGPYKEAIKLATMDARQENTDVCDSSVQDPLASPTALTLSPRPVNVLS